MEKIWLEKSYPPGVPFEINPDEYSSLVEMFNKSTRDFKDKVAFINMGAELSYGELENQARDFAAYLQSNLGLVKGDKFAIMSPNCLQYPVALFGALMAGLTVVNVNPLYTGPELEHQLTDSETKAILIIENYAHTLESVLARTPVKHIILTALGDRLGFVKGLLINTVVRHVKKMVPAYNIPGAVQYNSVLLKGKNLNFNPVEVTGSDIAFLQYTGGTTGPSKGAVLTHRNMIANLLQAKAIVGPNIEIGHELVVTALPLYHIFALTVNCLIYFSLGGTNLLITNPRDMPTVIKTLAKYRFTAMSGVNTLFNGMLNAPGFSSLDFSRFKVTIAGGMATQRAVAEKWHKVTNTHILEGFGLTECAPIVTGSPYNQTEFSGSVGLPVPSTDIRLLNDEGVEVPMGEPGEMWVKGPQVMSGYFNQKSATDEVLKDGWLATGDIATADENGFLKIVDRKKDMIIVSGFNVYPNEIEAVLAMHEGVLESAVIGEPNDETGEAVKAFVVAKDSKLDEKSLITHCKKSLTGYKLPKKFIFVDEMPKSNVGKILRKDLRG